MSLSVQTIVDGERRRRQARALAWLHVFRHDPELVALLEAADADDSLDVLFRLIVWASDRGMLLHPERLDRNGDPIPF